jgi:uncharacterized protein YerC
MQGKEPSADHVIALLKSSSQEILCEALAKTNSPQQIHAFLEDLLTQPEYANAVRRFEEALAFLVAKHFDLKEVHVCKALDMTFASYGRSKRLWLNGSGGWLIGLASAKKRFLALRIFKPPTAKR